MTHDESGDPLVFDALARVVPQIAPPPGLRARVLAAAAGAALRDQPPLPARAASAWPWLAAAAAALLALTAGGWWSASRDVARLQTTLTLQGSDSDGVADILAAEDVHGVPLQGLAPANAARARVFVSPSRGLVMAAEGLPVLPPGRVYQLWAIIGSTPVSAGVFERDGEGRATLLHHAPIASPAALAVTVEPAGGVPAPTGPKYLLGLAAS